MKRLAMVGVLVSMLGCATARRVVVRLKPEPACPTKAAFQAFACSNYGLCDGRAFLISPTSEPLDGWYITSNAERPAKWIRIDWEREFKKLCGR